MLWTKNLNRRGIAVYEGSGNEKYLVAICCGDGVGVHRKFVHGQLLPDLSISLDSRFSGRLAAGSLGLTSGEYAVNEKVSKFVAFTEGSVECIKNSD